MADPFTTPMGFWSLRQIAAGPAERVETYLGRLTESDRLGLSNARAVIFASLAGIEESMVCGFPTFHIQGRTLAGLAVASRDLMYLPFGAHVTEVLAEEFPGLRCTSSAIHFSADRPLASGVIHRAIALRLAQVSDS